jgi:hypothetical protein
MKQCVSVPVGDTAIIDGASGVCPEISESELQPCSEGCFIIQVGADEGDMEEEQEEEERCLTPVRRVYENPLDR